MRLDPNGASIERMDELKDIAEMEYTSERLQDIRDLAKAIENTPENHASEL